MPRDHRVTLLIARRQHQLEGHGTSADKLALKLQAIFWIKGIRALTTTVTKGCIECQKMNKQHGNQIMGCPPNLKMTSIKPFTIVSMDFAGPFKALLCRKVLKLYLLVCVCQQSKACHLELTMGMDAESLILAIERIVGRRGTIDKVHSDNGGNFAHTGKLLTPDEEELNSTLKEVEWKKVQEETSGESGIKEWTFSQPLNPEGNGLAEAHIKLAKKALETRWKKHTLQYEQFQTLVIKAENKINSRPIGGVTSTDDPNRNFMTPNHFLYGMKGSTVIPVMRQDKAVIHKDRWEELLKIHGEFESEYGKMIISDMHSREKWTRPQIDLQVNQSVLMINPMSKRSDWALGRVTETFPGSDGAIRNADVEMKIPKKTILRRNVRQLVLLESFSERRPKDERCL
jgi:hypothetical protein